MRFFNAIIGVLAALASVTAASAAPQLVLSSNYVTTVIAATNPTRTVEA